MTDPSLAAARPGAKRRAIADEQRHVERVHDRVELLRQRAEERAVAAGADHSGSTFQARFERDVTAHHHASRAARFTVGDVESLVFGRLDRLEPPDADTASGQDAVSLHIGRLSVVDDDGEVLLVDWRAPASAAFYQATAAEPLGVARRRTLVTRGRHVRDLDDEVLDAEAAERLDLEAVTGQGALLASLSRTTTGRMRDIVATIQTDQDRIIRAAAGGTLVVTGGPGTGKTVVALHRVAFLLYGDRERFEGRGVLVVGPSRAFTEYTARVLPSLGEDRAVQRPLAAFAPPGVTVDGWDEPEVAAVKGDLRLQELCRRAVAATLPPLPPTTRLTFDGTSVEVAASTLAKVRTRLLERLSPDVAGRAYHDRMDAAEEALRAALWRAWRAADRASGGRPPDERAGTGFDLALDDAPQVTMLRRCYWPVVDAERVLADVAEGRRSLAELASGLLEADEVALLRGAWDAATGWTVDDVALLDEIRALLGPPPHERRQDPPRDADDGMRVVADRLRSDVELVDVDADDYRDFAHIVVDEAQDLTPMQWRMVARRGPYASWTVVGDLAQRSRMAEPATWEDVAELIGRSQVEVTGLTVNYRTPVEVTELARDVLVAAGHDPSAVPESVRHGGEPPFMVRTADLTEAGAEQALTRAEAREGMVAIIAPAELVTPLRAAVEERADAVPEAVERIRVLDPRTAKGLEFDDVVVVAPDAIAASSAVGLHQLYVAVTRATRSLTLVAAPDAEVPGSARCVG